MLNITIAKADKMPGINSCYLQFETYNEAWIEVIRAFPFRSYNKNTRAWEFPLYQLENVIRRYRNLPVHIEYKLDRIEPKKIPENFEFKMEPFPYQLEGVEYGLTHDKWILGDEQGLGKTFQVINLARALKQLGKVKQCLIICAVSDLRFNWEKEIKKFSDEDCFVLGTRFTKREHKRYIDSIAERVEDLKTHKEFFLITNVETLLNEKFIQVLNNEYKRTPVDIDMLVIDECHKCNNINSNRGANLLKLKNFTYKVAISGTPLKNSPLDAYFPLTWIDKEHSSFGTFKKFYSEYSDDLRGDIIGFKNLEMLHKQLDSCMLRRRKDEVLDLPEKIFQTEFVTMSKKQAEIYEEAKTWVLQNIDLISNSPNPLAQLIRLRQATGFTGILSSTVQESAKLDKMVDIVNDVANEGRKALVFSNWTKITDEALKRLKDFNPLYIAGDMDDKNSIEEIKSKFQTQPEYKVLIGTTGKMGTGHTLTAATTVIFLDSPWTPADKQQAIDRVHRIGALGTINIITICCKDTIDERIEEILERKATQIDFIVDGKSPAQRKELIQFLLS